MPCAGQHTLLTQGYTPEIAKLVHQAITKDIARANGASKRSLADGSHDSGSVSSYKGRALLSIGIEEMDEGVALSTLAG